MYFLPQMGGLIVGIMEVAENLSTDCWSYLVVSLSLSKMKETLVQRNIP